MHQTLDVTGKSHNMYKIPFILFLSYFLCFVCHAQEVNNGIWLYSKYAEPPQSYDDLSRNYLSWVVERDHVKIILSKKEVVTDDGVRWSSDIIVRGKDGENTSEGKIARISIALSASNDGLERGYYDIYIYPDGEDYSIETIVVGKRFLYLINDKYGLPGMIIDINDGEVNFVEDLEVWRSVVDRARHKSHAGKDSKYVTPDHVKNDLQLIENVLKDLLQNR